MDGTREEYLFRCQGGHWMIAYDRRTLILPDSVGLRYLAALIRHPWEAVHASEVRGEADKRGGGRRRRRRSTASDSERDRLAVTKGIKGALARIGQAHPALGEHFEASIRCGYHCRYLPDPRHPIRWIE